MNTALIHKTYLKSLRSMHRAFFMQIINNFRGRADITILDANIVAADNNIEEEWHHPRTKRENPEWPLHLEHSHAIGPFIRYKEADLLLGVGYMANGVSLNFPVLKHSATSKYFNSWRDNPPKVEVYDNYLNTQCKVEHAENTGLDDLYAKLPEAYKRWMRKKTKAEAGNAALPETIAKQQADWDKQWADLKKPANATRR
jgi:hypothetical protein